MKVDKTVGFIEKGAILKTKVKLIDPPEEMIPLKWQVKHKLKLLEINGVNIALTGLADLASKDIRDLKKLLKTIKLQLNSKDIIHNSQKIQKGKKSNQKKIIEIKATRGHSRLLAFFSEKNEIIICTHTYWKTSSNKKQQNREFDKAANLYQQYLKHYKKNK